jgi:hypothetical protein
MSNIPASLPLPLTLKELNACIMGLAIVKEDCELIQKDKTTFNKEAKLVSEDLLNTCISAIEKISKATGLDPKIPDYVEGDEKEFIINPKQN